MVIETVSHIKDRAIFIIDTSGAIKSASSPAKALLEGFEPAASTLNSIFPGVLEKLLRELSKYSSGDATVELKNSNFWIVDLKNKTYWLEYSDVSSDRAKDGELYNLKKKVRRVEELASLGDMVAQISHELNTPLGICITSASHLADKLTHLNEQFNKGELTQRDMRDTLAASRSSINLVNSNLIRTSKIINNFRSLSKDTRRHDKEKLCLHQYINNILSQLQPLLEKNCVYAGVDISSDIFVYESPSSLSQILSNLVVNSLRHGFTRHADTLQPEIGISACIKDQWVEVTYRDNGVGVSENIKSNIFDPFVSGARDDESAGLGMSIIREIVQEDFNGEVNLLPTTSGFKLTFTMRLHK
jgi:signal transduction histidine kinase